MFRGLSQYFVLFFLAIVLQLFVFNNIQLSGYINPYIYVVIILLLPYETPGGILLFVAFGVGLLIDMVMNTLGMHTSATLCMAFLRPYILSSLTTRDDVERKGMPTMALNGIAWSIRYTLIMVFAHHFILFFLEVFSLNAFFITLWRIIVSSIITSVFILFAQYFAFRIK